MPDIHYLLGPAMLIYCWIHKGPMSQTMCQHQTNIKVKVIWDVTYLSRKHPRIPCKLKIDPILTQQTRQINPMLDHHLRTLMQHWVNVSFLLGRPISVYKSFCRCNYEFYGTSGTSTLTAETGFTLPCLQWGPLRPIRALLPYYSMRMVYKSHITEVSKMSSSLHFSASMAI